MTAEAAGGQRWPPRLYPISDRHLASATHAEIATELAAAGARWLQLRDKTARPGELLRAARSVRVSAPELVVIVNDRLDVALASGCAGVHLGDRDLAAGVARAVAGPELIIGVLTHSVEEALRAQDEPCDYVALGPVFPTSTKSDARPAVGLEALRQVARSATKPLVAIGGIDLSRAEAVLEAGADSVAVISAVMVKGEVRERARRLLALLDAATKASGAAPSV